MIYSDVQDLPNDHKPEHLIIINEDVFDNAMQDYKSGQFLLDPNIHYLVKPTASEAKEHPITKILHEEGLLKDNGVLLLDKEAKDTRYLPYDLLTKKTIQFQMQTFVELCQLLGAKKVRCITNENNENRSSLTSETKADTGSGFTANIGSDANKNAKLKSKLENNTSFSDGTVNLAEAERLMKTDIFSNNENIVAFYNSARRQENRMKHQKVTFQVAQDISKQLSLIAGIDAPIFNKTIASAELKKSSHELKSLYIEYEVEF